MARYPGVVGGDSTKQQERHYYLLSELQALVKDLPRYDYFRFGKDFTEFHKVMRVNAISICFCIKSDWLLLCFIFS